MVENGECGVSVDYGTDRAMDDIAALRSYGDTLSDAAFVLIHVLEMDGTVRSGDEEVRRLRLAMDRYDSYRSER